MTTHRDPRVYALILAGGAGTRFWPASRAGRPKQLLPLLGSEPLIRDTVLRVLPLCEGEGAGAGDAAASGWDRVLVASGRHLIEPTAKILPELPSQRNLLAEPIPRNTAPCIGWAAAIVARRDPEAVLMVLPSDHHIADVARFREVLSVAVASAASGVITTIGIRPTHPETGYGYIEVEASAASAAGGGSTNQKPEPVRALRFVEKPDRARAEAFLKTGRFYWNAGMFFFRAKDMLAAIREKLPALAEGLDAFDRAAAESPERELAEVARLFPGLPSVSIDKGVMEHVDRLSVVPGDFGWSDIGSWHSAWELAAKDDNGNSAPDGTVFVDARRNHVVDLRPNQEGARRVIALVGVEDLVVVETGDALLVVPRDRAQDVREVVERLRSRGDEGLV